LQAGSGRRCCEEGLRKGIDEIGGGWNIEREEGTRTGGTQINIELASMWRADLLLFYELCA
jgi:hypothetical protein